MAHLPCDRRHVTTVTPKKSFTRQDDRAVTHTCQAAAISTAVRVTGDDLTGDVYRLTDSRYDTVRVTNLNELSEGTLGPTPTV
jgi:hypothetical protein